jgi:hypothetical protein
MPKTAPTIAPIAATIMNGMGRNGIINPLKDAGLLNSCTIKTSKPPDAVMAPTNDPREIQYIGTRLNAICHQA